MAEIIEQHGKAHIVTINSKKIAEKKQTLYEEFCQMTSINPSRRIENSRVKRFQAKLVNTMPFWPRNEKKENLLRSKKITSIFYFWKARWEIGRLHTKDLVQAKVEDR